MSKREPMTPEQRRLARHALGLPNARARSYRKHFVASVGAHQRLWREMVDGGLATPFASVNFPDGLQCFHLTRAGAEAALDPGETLDDEDFPATAEARA